jgi:MFS family permease
MASSPTPLARLRALVSGLPRPFWFLWAGMLVTRAGSFVLPFLALYLTQGLHIPASRAGLVIGLYGAGGAVAAPLGGWLTDHLGRRIVLVGSLLLGGTGMIAAGFAHRLEVLAPAIFLLATVNEMYRPAMQAAVADLVSPEERVHAFGLIYWVINMGFAIGLTVGGLLAARSFLWLFVGDGVTTLAFAAIVCAGVPETRPARAPRPPGEPHPHPVAEFFAPYRDGLFVSFLVLGFLFAVLFMQNASSFALETTAHGVSRATFGRILALNGVIIVLVQPFLGPALVRFNRSLTLAWGGVLAGLGFGLFAFVHTVSGYAIGTIVWTIGEIMALPVANAVVADLAPVELRGRYQGAYGLAFALAVSLAPAMGMFTFERFGSFALWIGCLLAGLVVAAGHLALRPALTAARQARLAAQAVPPAA